MNKGWRRGRDRRESRKKKITSLKLITCPYYEPRVLNYYANFLKDNLYGICLGGY